MANKSRTSPVVKFVQSGQVMKRLSSTNEASDNKKRAILDALQAKEILFVPKIAVLVHTHISKGTNLPDMHALNIGVIFACLFPSLPVRCWAFNVLDEWKSKMREKELSLIREVLKYALKMIAFRQFSRKGTFKDLCAKPRDQVKNSGQIYFEEQDLWTGMVKLLKFLDLKSELTSNSGPINADFIRVVINQIDPKSPVIRQACGLFTTIITSGSYAVWSSSSIQPQHVLKSIIKTLSAFGLKTPARLKCLEILPNFLISLEAFGEELNEFLSEVLRFLFSAKHYGEKRCFYFVKCGLAIINRRFQTTPLLLSAVYETQSLWGHIVVDIACSANCEKEPSLKKRFSNPVKHWSPAQLDALQEIATRILDNVITFDCQNMLKTLAACGNEQVWLKQISEAELNSPHTGALESNGKFHLFQTANGMLVDHVWKRLMIWDTWDIPQSTHIKMCQSMTRMPLASEILFSPKKYWPNEGKIDLENMLFLKAQWVKMRDSFVIYIEKLCSDASFVNTFILNGQWVIEAMVLLSTGLSQPLRAKASEFWLRTFKEELVEDCMKKCLATHDISLKRFIRVCYEFTSELPHIETCTLIMPHLLRFLPRLTSIFLMEIKRSVLQFHIPGNYPSNREVQLIHAVSEETLRSLLEFLFTLCTSEDASMQNSQQIFVEVCKFCRCVFSLRKEAWEKSTLFDPFLSALLNLGSRKDDSHLYKEWISLMCEIMKHPNPVAISVLKTKEAKALFDWNKISVKDKYQIGKFLGIGNLGDRGNVFPNKLTPTNPNSSNSHIRCSPEFSKFQEEVITVKVPRLSKSPKPPHKRVTPILRNAKVVQEMKPVSLNFNKPSKSPSPKLIQRKLKKPVHKKREKRKLPQFMLPPNKKPLIPYHSISKLTVPQKRKADPQKRPEEPPRKKVKKNEEQQVADALKVLNRIKAQKIPKANARAPKPSSRRRQNGFHEDRMLHLAGKARDKVFQNERKQRLKPVHNDLEELLLGWDPLKVNTDVKTEVHDDLAPVPNALENCAEYEEYFYPLLKEECRAMIFQELEPYLNRHLEIRKIKKDPHAEEDGFLDIFHVHKSPSFSAETTQVELKGGGSKDPVRGVFKSYQEKDLLVLFKGKPVKEGSGYRLQDATSCCFGVVERKNIQNRECTLSVRLKSSKKLSQDFRLKSWWFLLKVSSLTTIYREFQALKALKRSIFLRFVLDPKVNPKLTQEEVDTCAKSLPPSVQKSLNKSQLQAVSKALCTKGFRLIQGPPGCGKTRTIVELIMCILKGKARNQSNKTSPRILVCAPSNAACDEIATRLISRQGNGRGLIRIGSRESRTDMLKKIHINNIVHDPSSLHSKESKQVQLSTTESNVRILQETLRKLKQGNRQKEDEEQIERVSEELRQAQKKKRQLKADCEKAGKLQPNKNKGERNKKLEILNSAKVIFSTLSGSGLSILANLNREFDFIIIDESTQSVELSTLIPLRYKAKACILVGDPRQLPATVLSRDAAQVYDYERSLFERLMKGGIETDLLNVQYRMHEDIRKFPSIQFYENKLTDGPNIAKMATLSFYKANDLRIGPYCVFDCLHGKERRAIRNPNSIENPEEAYMVAKIVHFLTDVFSKDNKYFSPDSKIAIVTPYRGQVGCIYKALREMKIRNASRIYVNTVDAFQGQEKDIIIFCCVRTSKRTIGFVADTRRLNVAITRARHALFIVGFSPALRTNDIWRALFADAHVRKKLLVTRSRGDVNNIFLMNAAQVRDRFSPEGSRRRKQKQQMVKPLKPKVVVNQRLDFLQNDKPKMTKRPAYRNLGLPQENMRGLSIPKKSHVEVPQNWTPATPQSKKAFKNGN